MTRGELLTRVSGLAVCVMLAGCVGSGSNTPVDNDGPDVIVAPPGDDTPDTSDDTDMPEDEEEEEDGVVDVITDILTTSVSVTTITATGGS